MLGVGGFKLQWGLQTSILPHVIGLIRASRTELKFEVPDPGERIQVQHRASASAWKPTKQQLAAARGKRIRDVIGEDLTVLFVGINPSLYSAAVGHHFARPGNRFWPALHRGGFTPRQLSPFEDQSLLDYRLGLTNLVARATARADELGEKELQRGAARLRSKLRRWQPTCVAFVGISAYRTALNEKQARVGQQATDLCGCSVWVLPNPSGLNAHYQLDDFGKLFTELREIVNA